MISIGNKIIIRAAISVVFQRSLRLSVLKATVRQRQATFGYFAEV